MEAMKPKRPYKYNIGDLIKDEKRNLIVLDRKVETKEDSQGERNLKIYTLKCNRCGSIIEKEEKRLFTYKIGCICNDQRITITGYNDIATTRPDLVKFFVDKDLTTQYRANSTKVVLLKCPECGTEKRSKIYTLSNNGFSCPKCSDGISYPNKFAYALFDQLKIDYIPEYNPKWSGNKRYDIYFEINNRSYILEMDGGWHYKDNNLSKKTKEVQQHEDKQKEILANSYNIEVIRIDCKISDCQYIKNNILDSKLNELFDLNKINWSLCEEKASQSIVVAISKYYMENNHPTIKEMMDIFNISHNTVSKYLQSGAIIGLCDYVDKETKANQHYLDTIKEYNKNPNIELNTLAKIIGINSNQIRTYLKRGTNEGLCNFLSKEDKKKEKINHIKNLLQNDPSLSPSEIIKITNYPSTTVRRIYKELMPIG